MSKRNVKLFNRLIGFFTLFVFLLGVFRAPFAFDAIAQQDNTSSMQFASAVNSGYEGTAARDIQDGVTLHCWNWSFNNIKANMKTIAEQGYTAIQTSPIQQAKEATNSANNGNWWVYYQPMGFHIDNSGTSALGTKAEFESMCDEAHKYGIKVIVDVVANHLGNNRGNDLANTLVADIKNDTNCWHDIKQNIDYNKNSRYEITQKCMGGLPDLNTGNTKVQQYVIDFLKECIDAGADGFRFDAAKHIETPDDTSSGCASNFWPNVIDTAKSYATGKGIDLYCYGEILDSPGGSITVASYTKYMSVTDNRYGNSLLHNIRNKNSGCYGSTFPSGAEAKNLVLWAESHDTFANDQKESTFASTNEINKTWALIAGRGHAMGLYLARPTNYKHLNNNSDPLGAAGKTGWENKEVAEVNKFHNYFVGTGEWISNSGNISYIERGDSGVVLVNVSGTTTSVNVDAHLMKNGTYTDQITGSKFTVSNGKITGQIGSTGIAVVYNAIPQEQGSTEKETTTPSSSTKNIAYLKLPSGWGTNVYCYAYDNATGKVNNGVWPGQKMQKVSEGLYKCEVPDNIEGPRVIFYVDNDHRYPADGVPGLILEGSMVFDGTNWKVYEEPTTKPTETSTTKKQETTTTKKQESTTTTKKQEVTTTKKNESTTTTKKQEGTTTTKRQEATTTKKGESTTTTKKQEVTTTKKGETTTTTKRQEVTTTKKGESITTTNNSGETVTTTTVQDVTNNSEDVTTKETQAGEDSTTAKPVEDSTTAGKSEETTTVAEGELTSEEESNKGEGSTTTSEETTSTIGSGADGDDGTSVFVWVFVAAGGIAVGVAGVCAFSGINPFKRFKK